MEIPIIFEDDDVVVLNKPAGLMVHADGFRDEKTVADWFLHKYPASQGVGEQQLAKDGSVLERSGVVHRLDTDTSGVMIMAKNQTAFDHLKKQFHDRLAKKEYRAIVYDHMRDKWGTIDRPIGRSARDFRLRSAERGAKGALREAVTDWELVGKGEYEGESFSYIKLKPKTGRTHQLRVHLKAIDRPIVGDRLYAGKKLTTSNNLGLDRLALHAYILEISLPNGDPQRFMAPLPQSFIEAEDRLCSPAEE
jgi:23S rRNA pseudouridine1911/1915/1917 synthase